jgi:hypothetical protein
MYSMSANHVSCDCPNNFNSFSLLEAKSTSVSYSEYELFKTSRNLVIFHTCWSDLGPSIFSMEREHTDKFSYLFIGRGSHFHSLLFVWFVLCALNLRLACEVTEQRRSL